MDDLEQCRRALGSDNLAERLKAAEQLAASGEGAAEACVELVIACGGDSSVSEWAVSALESMGAPNPESEQQLAGLLNDQSELVGYWAATLLGRLGSITEATQTALAKTLTESPSASTRQRAAWALGKVELDSPAAVDALRAAGESPDPRLARLAKAALA